MKHYWIITALCISACLSGCSLLGGEAVPNLSRTKSAASKVNAAAPSKTAPVETTFAETSSAETEDEDEDLNTALFRSAAATAQMEITTGLTTEFLDMICSYPVTVMKGDSVTVLKDLDDLEEMGLEALYTDALLKAVGDADPDAIVIVDDTALLGDPDGAYIVLGKDQTDVIGITEFHYPE